jgi:hypothetical protein
MHLPDPSGYIPILFHQCLHADLFWLIGDMKHKYLINNVAP